MWDYLRLSLTQQNFFMIAHENTSDRQFLSMIGRSYRKGVEVPPPFVGTVFSNYNENVHTSEDNYIEYDRKTSEAPYVLLSNVELVVSYILRILYIHVHKDCLYFYVHA